MKLVQTMTIDVRTPAIIVISCMKKIGQLSTLHLYNTLPV